MLRHMTKTMSAGLLAATVALTGVTATATPATANGHRNNGGEAAAVLGGLLLLYGLSQAGNNNGGGHVVRPNHPRPLGGRPNIQHNLRVAPERCFVQGNGPHGQFRGFARRCMQQHVAAPHLLPQQCIRNIYSHNGPGQIYGGRCLRNHGWTRG